MTKANPDSRGGDRGLSKHLHLSLVTMLVFLLRLYNNLGEPLTFIEHLLYARPCCKPWENHKPGCHHIRFPDETVEM